MKQGRRLSELSFRNPVHPVHPVDSFPRPHRAPDFNRRQCPRRHQSFHHADGTGQQTRHVLLGQQSQPCRASRLVHAVFLWHGGNMEWALQYVKALFYFSQEPPWPLRPFTNSFPPSRAAFHISFALGLYWFSPSPRWSLANETNSFSESHFIP